MSQTHIEAKMSLRKATLRLRTFLWLNFKLEQIPLKLFFFIQQKLQDSWKFGVSVKRFATMFLRKPEALKSSQTQKLFFFTNPSKLFSNFVEAFYYFTTEFNELVNFVLNTYRFKL